MKPIEMNAKNKRRCYCGIRLTGWNKIEHKRPHVNAIERQWITTATKKLRLLAQELARFHFVYIHWVYIETTHAPKIISIFSLPSGRTLLFTTLTIEKQNIIRARKKWFKTLKINLDSIGIIFFCVCVFGRHENIRRQTQMHKWKERERKTEEEWYNLQFDKRKLK